MKAAYGGAAPAKIRAMRAYSLRAFDYDELCGLRSLRALILRLRQNPSYSPVLKDGDEESYFSAEASIHTAIFYKYDKLCRFFRPNEAKVLRFIITRAEINEILRYLHYILSGSAKDYHAPPPQVTAKYSDIGFTELSGKKTYADLLVAAKNTPYYDILLPFIENPSYPDIEYALYSHYYQSYIKTAKQSLSGKEKDEITQAILMRADFANLSIVLRFSSFYGIKRERGELDSRLLPFGRYFSRDFLDNLSAAPGRQEKLALLSSTPYGKYFSEGEGQSIYLDTLLSRFYLEYFTGLIYSSPHAVTSAMAYMHLFEIETSNIVNIIEGVRYNLSPDKIKQYLYL